ncbi:ATP-binding protein [Alsobacter sp. KACC 23698]|uniref:histidine kinase n=1 Tax=Alsobacter sp. KACC 23698 TaxID=3149229 RepID=A0AAU7JFH0_9HYPH
MAEPARPTILLVEDSRTQALKFGHSLEGQGYAVDWVATAEEALDRLNGTLPDLVIADYHLPGMNGDGLARQIRLNVRTRTIPVMMLTEAREHGIERKGLESGADAYVPKSVAEDIMALRIKALLRRSETPPAAAEPGPAVASRDHGAYRRPTLLVIDPSGRELAFLRDLLTSEGYTVETAAGAEGARDLAGRSVPLDGVILGLFQGAAADIALCKAVDAVRTGLDGAADGPSFPIFAVQRATDPRRDGLADIFASGADDVVAVDVDADVLVVRIRALVRRKLVRDENRRIEREWRAQQLDLQRARAETLAAQARASMAEALSKANAELEAANAQLKDAQAKLVQAAKMASLGELVAGIAHEINNPLAFILAHQSTVERLLGQASEELGPEFGAAPAIEKAKQRVTSMRVGLKRIEDIVANLRRFSRLDEGEFQTVDVPASIETVLALLAHKLAGGVEVIRRYEGDRELYCSSALLNQVVMNIVGNAADAMGGHGTIQIRTASDGETYTIEILDSGPGVPEDLRERIFEPFFTTKPVGAGTGLGLAISFSVVQAHQGSLTVGSGPDGGALFTITIPRRNRS